MRKNYYYYLAILICSILISNSAFASHGTGGELTWTCQGNGQYVFQLKFYRDCNGIPGPGAININTTVPGVPYIMAPLVSQTDISPVGFAANGITPCPTCAQGNGGSPIFGVIEEFIYETAPVSLNGIPPAQGWTFSWGECCRSSAISNIMGAGGLGFLIQAKMFAYQGQNAGSCFDSSPYFAEKPHFVTCSGFPVTYQHLAFDAEYDSIDYNFDAPLDEMGNPIPFASGFSIQQPLADPVTLNHSTGELSFTPITAGYFVLVIKASAYKCGILVAEIRREINILISNNCNPVFGGVANQAPVMDAPFEDPITFLYTSYADTVTAGDSLSFPINSYDLQQFTNQDPQQVTFNAYGLQYGAGFTDPSAGCLIPPCAVLSPPPPVVNNAVLTTQFNWGTTTAHLGYSFSCVQFSNTYYFINKSQDNYCPANGVNSRVFSITVVPAIPPPPVVNNNGNLECNLGPGYIYQWFLNRFAIPGASATSYTPVQVGTYQVLAVAPDGQGNYSDGYYYNPLGIAQNDFITAVSVQPNPSADGIFRLNAELKFDSRLSIYVSDVFGRIVLSDVWTSTKGQNNLSLDLSNHADGVYIVKLSNENSESRNLKLIKAK